MRKIYKYVVGLGFPVTHDLPAGCKVIHGEMQGAEACIWVLFDDSIKEKVASEFMVFGTGHEIPDEFEYLGTFQQPPFVWHVCSRVVGDA